LLTVGMCGRKDIKEKQNYNGSIKALS